MGVGCLQGMVIRVTIVRGMAVDVGGGYAMLLLG